jgi:hypothetical protein
MAIWSITHFTLLPDYKIAVSFADGTSGIADLAPRLTQGRLGDGFDLLCDEKLFSRALLKHGALAWSGGSTWHRMRCISEFGRPVCEPEHSP